MVSLADGIVGLLTDHDKLYLPRTYSAAPGEANVMVGRADTRHGDDIVSNALMSLLREGGQWDEIDDKRNGTGSSFKRHETLEEPWSPAPRRNSAVRHPLLAAFGRADHAPARKLHDSFWSVFHETYDLSQSDVLAVAPQTSEIPTEIRIHVKQEVVEHREGGDELRPPRPLV